MKIKISVKQDNIDHNCKELHVKSQTFKTKTFTLIFFESFAKGRSGCVGNSEMHLHQEHVILDQVHHECAWGCRGQFVPSRYNSSRAKCIKCHYCGVFFSPNKVNSLIFI